MKPQEKINFNEFKELDKHQGSENYDVFEIVPNKARVSDFYGKSESPNMVVDTVSKTVMIGAYGLKEGPDEISGTYLSDFLGNYLNTKRILGRVLKDGTIWETATYSNLLIDGNITKHKYADPFSNQEIDDPYKFKAKEQDLEKWMQKFKELYFKAQYIYIGSGFYYFKINGKWYLMDDNLEGLPDDLKQQYPAKEDQDVRMVELQNLAPLWYHKGFEERDTSLIKMIDYESTYYTEKKGLDSFQYSAGWWYLEVYMPLGDTIRIKRYSYFEDPNLRLYKIPAVYGGREDVLFIVQIPKDAHMEQVAGMYAIRPRDPEQPQKRYKSIVYYRDENGERHIDEKQSEETEEYKAWREKQKK